MMRKRLYHTKTKSILSSKLDDIQQQCKNTTKVKNDSSVFISKQLLLQNYETYSRKAKTSRQQQLFLSRATATPNRFFNRTQTAKKNRRSLSKDADNNSALHNSLTTSLNHNRYFPSQSNYPPHKIYGNFDERSIELQRDVYEYFLSELYSQKVKDLKIPMNKRQKKMFITRLIQKVNETSLEIPHSDLGYHCICAVSYFLKKKTYFMNIQKLVLDQNNFGDKGIIKVSSSIRLCKNLLDISLVSVSMGTTGSEALFRAINGHPNLQKINVSSCQTKGRNKIGTSPINILKQVLKNPNCKLKCINLSNTCIGSDGFYLLCSGLENYPNQIQTLNVSSNQIRIRQEDLPKIRSKLENTRIRRIQFQDNLMENMGASLIGFLLGIKYGQNQISKATIYVDLSSNGVKSKGLQHLCMSLSQNHRISELNLADNKLCQGQSFYTIRYLLTHNWSLNKLSLKKSITDSTNFKYISQGLQKNRSLRWLDLSQNRIPPTVFNDFLINIIPNKTLRTLKLNSCQISDEHIIKGYNSLKINKSIQSLSLINNFINPKGAKILLKLLQQNKRICELFLKKNCIDTNTIKQIAFQAKQNIAFVMNQGDPDLNYFQYAQKMQQNHYSNLLKTVKQLQNKSQKYKTNHVKNMIVQKNEQISKITKQIENQNQMIEQLEKKLRNMSNKDKYSPKDINFATQVDIQ